MWVINLLVFMTLMIPFFSSEGFAIDLGAPVLSNDRAEYGVIFDATPLNRYRDMTLAQTRLEIERKKSVLGADIENPNNVFTEIQLIRQLQSTCPLVDQLIEIFNPIVTEGCSTKEIKRNCRLVSGVLEGELSKVETLAIKERIDFEKIKKHHDALEISLKKISDQNKLCSESFKKLSDDKCLKIYDVLFSESQRNRISSSCSTEEANRLFIEFEGYIRGNRSPFSGFIVLQDRRLKSREAEFKIARTILELREIMRVIEQPPGS